MKKSLKELALEKQAMRKKDDEMKLASEKKNTLYYIEEIEALIPRLIKETELALIQDRALINSLVNISHAAASDYAKRLASGDGCVKVDGLEELNSLLAAMVKCNPGENKYTWLFTKITPEFAEIVDKLSECLDEKGHLKGANIEMEMAKR